MKRLKAKILQHSSLHKFNKEMVDLSALKKMETLQEAGIPPGATNDSSIQTLKKKNCTHYFLLHLTFKNDSERVK
jgi:hypothetical protein